MGRTRLAGMVFACLAALLLTASSAVAGDKGLMVGGPCAYAEFPGKAVIVAVRPRVNDMPATGMATPYPGFDVTFSFTPDKPISGEPLYQPGRIQPLTLVNGMAPGPRFLKKYGIAPGKTLPCRLRLIRQGTCTPVIYAFPGIDLTDYFELKKP